ncbi:MAG: TolC family protein [Bacteroidales bacterium]|jgi:outer membrane protein TolC
MVKRKQKKSQLTAILMGILFLTGTLNVQAEPRDTLRLTIEKALEIAMSDNLNIKIANAELERVDYLKKENWYMLLPSVNGSAQYTNNILKPVFFSDFFPGGKMEVGSTHSYAVGGTMQVPLLSFALYKNIELSELEIKSALESARTTKLDLVAQVKNSFYGIIMISESLKVLEQSYKNAMESANNIKNMYEKGLASEYDKIRSEVAARNIMPTLTQARNGLELAKMQLKILLSLKMDTPIAAEGSFSIFENEINNFQKNLSFSFDLNSSLKSMEIQLEKMNKNFELIHSQRLPMLAGFANYQLQMQSNEFSFNKAWSNSFAMGISLQIPIFNKLSVSMKEKQTQVVIRKMEYQRDLLRENLSLSAQNSINEMTRAKIQLESDKEAARQAKKGYEIAKVRYSTGVGTVLELNDTEVALTRSQLNLNQTLYDFLKAKNEFERVLGTENISKQ